MASYRSQLRESFPAVRIVANWQVALETRYLVFMTLKYLPSKMVCFHVWTLVHIKEPQCVHNGKTLTKGISNSVTEGAFPVARRKKEDIPLAESDIKCNFRPMECLLFFSRQDW